jgi:hypothetical protein
MTLVTWSTMDKTACRRLCSLYVLKLVYYIPTRQFNSTCTLYSIPPYQHGINGASSARLQPTARGSRSSPEEGRRGQLLRTCRACFHRKHNSIPITLGETSRAGAVDARTFACETSCARPCRLFRKQLLYQIPALSGSLTHPSTRNRDDASTDLAAVLLAAPTTQRLPRPY